MKVNKKTKSLFKERPRSERFYASSLGVYRGRKVACAGISWGPEFGCLVRACGKAGLNLLTKKVSRGLRP